jgi:hypothetical protein
MAPDPTAQLITTLVTYILMGALILIISVPVTKRKGKSLVKTVLFTFIPIVNIFYLFWIISLTDKSVIDDINALKEKLKV